MRIDIYIFKYTFIADNIIILFLLSCTLQTYTFNKYKKLPLILLATIVIEIKIKISVDENRVNEETLFKESIEFHY